MNRKSRTAACRSPEQTRPRLLTGYRAPAAAACSHVAAGSTRHARLRPDQGSIPLVAPRSGQPGRPTLRMDWPVGSNSRARSSGSRPARTRSTIWRRNSGEYGGCVLGIGSTSGESFRVSTNSGSIPRAAPAGSLPGRLSDAGPQHRRIAHEGPASETLHLTCPSARGQRWVGWGEKRHSRFLPAYDPQASKAVIHRLRPRHPRLFQRCRWSINGKGPIVARERLPLLGSVDPVDERRGMATGFGP